ncbi:MAG TPA: NrfD/PsrC family molybdoenzyme membrane anchor subunit [Terriglobales bacterium]|nr:NrfD/PsrC family molybdoenzyme membrane anchor subunit [Terriglobales bacterium]
MAEPVHITEERLDTLREEAARNGKVQTHGIVPVASPFPKPACTANYNGNPVLKPPTWTWQVPLYFFVGGVAGTSSLIALIAHLYSNAGLLRAALWVGFAGALISPLLLIADLGKPARFLNMLRVFKLRSAMSVGAWTLVGFSGAVGLATVCHEVILAGHGSPLLLLEWVSEIIAAFTGLILASYASVLLGVSAIPVWSENRKLVPSVFLAGGLGSAAAVLELLGFLLAATQFIGIVASTVETVIAIVIELRGRYVDRPLREGAVGWLVRAGGALAGPVSLLLRIFWTHNPELRYLADLCFIAGALISRYAWIAAGRVSSRDPEALFEIQRHYSKVAATQ